MKKEIILDLLKMFLIITIISVLVNFILFSTIFKQKRVATVDLNVINYEYARSLNGLNDFEKEKNIKNFVIRTNQLLHQIAKENNLIIFPKQAIFIGEDIDLTNQVQGVLLNEIK